MMNPASFWNRAPLFWKTYVVAVLFVAGIIAVGELSEDWWEALLGVEQIRKGNCEVLIWLVDALVPTAIGCLFLSRLFTGTISRLSKKYDPPGLRGPGGAYDGKGLPAGG